MKLKGDERMEIRSTGSIRYSIQDNKKVISGYAVKWGKWSREIRDENGLFFERMLKGAFVNSLRDRNQLALAEHYKLAYLGSVEDGTLSLEEDEVGLAFKLVLSNSVFAKLVYERVKSGEFSHVSVCFVSTDDIWEIKDKKRYRTVKEASLIEISLCADPAYTDTVAKVGDRREHLKLQHKINEINFMIRKKELLLKINKTLKL